MTIFIFLVVLSVLVLIHELGHFLAARMFGVKADEFGYGFPPRIFGFVKVGKKWKYVRGNDQGQYVNTVWSVNWLPLGGFVKIKGETMDGIHDADSIHSKPIWQRIVIIAAGVTMNWILAVALFTLVFSIGTKTILDSTPVPSAVVRDQGVMVVDVLPKSPADVAGLQMGDDILLIDNVKPTDEKNARDLILAHGTTPVDIQYRDEGQIKTAQITPVQMAEVGHPAIGVGLANAAVISLPLPQAFLAAVSTSYQMTKLILFSFGQIVHDLFVKQKVTQDVSGPVGIAVMTGHVARQGIMPLLEFAAMLSLNLAVVNFLPIPALDGGRALFLVIEAIRRKPINRKLEMGIHNVTFLLLIMLILIVTVHDFSQYGGMIVGGLKGMVGR